MKILLFKRIKRKKKHRWRKIFYAQHKAREIYYCSECDNPIHHGFYYRREVWALKGWLIVDRIHENPPCEFFFPPDDYDENEFKQQEELALAS